jgi:hypothetical protein
MADKPPKRKTNTEQPPDGVLGTLPASRPERLGKPRPAAPKRRPAPKPAAVTPGCPPLRVSRPTDAPPARRLGPPTGTELVTTAIRASGELAQIGFVVGGQVVKRTLHRLKP